MDDNDDEHNFSDDGFDELPDSTLQELEHNAILSTQQARAQPNKPPQQYPTRPQPARIPAPLSRAGIHAQVGAPGRNGWNDSALPDEYDDDSFEWIGDEGISTHVEEVQSFIPQPIPPGEMTQREQWRNQRFGRPSIHAQPPPQPVRIPQYSTYQQPQPASRAYNNDHADPAVQNTKVTALQPALTDDSKNPDREEGLLARIEGLMQERDKLAKELHETKDQVMTQKGEIAIIRDNKDKESKVFDRQLTALKKSMQEELDRNRTAMQALAGENSRVISDNSFLKHDLAVEAERGRALELRLKGRPSERPAGPTTTPRKGVASSLRDGFDDDEIMAVSPVKSARRSKPPTPSAAARRKRKADAESPIKPLVLRLSNKASRDEAAIQAETTQTGETPVAAGRKDRCAERHLRFMQKILNYRLRSGGGRLIEELIKYSIPSDNRETFSSIVLDRTAKLTPPRLPADMLQIFLDLWARSLKEKYYDCVAILLEVVDHVIDIDMSVVDKAIITALIPILQDSISINAEVRFKHSPVYHKNQNTGRPTPQSALTHAINGTSCLSLVYKTACIISSDFALIDHFWRSLSTDFILMLLSPWQPIPDITFVFSLLSTSIFPGTFGNICSDEATQSKMEGYFLERICYMLWETPKVDETLPPLSKPTITQFRLAAMNLLSHLAITSSPPPHDDPNHHGSLLLATHPTAIARVVRALYDSVAALYTCPPRGLTSLHSQLINTGVRLLYHLTTVHAPAIDLSQKLAAVNGGVHKHRVVLTRLAFSEGRYVDREVSDEAVAMATAMLEESVTPDEAETLIEAFPGFVGRRRKVRDEGADEDREMDVDVDVDVDVQPERDAGKG